MSLTRYTLTDQLAILEAYMNQGGYRALAFIGRNHNEIIQLGLERAASVGFKDYEDKSFHLTPAGLSIETMQEAADMFVYQAIYSAKEAGAIP